MASNENKKEKSFNDVVSQDKDWRSLVDSELKCQASWNKEWGYLVDDKSNL